MPLKEKLEGFDSGLAVGLQPCWKPSGKPGGSEGLFDRYWTKEGTPNKLWGKWAVGALFGDYGPTLLRERFGTDEKCANTVVKLKESIADKNAKLEKAKEGNDKKMIGFLEGPFGLQYDEWELKFASPEHAEHRRRSLAQLEADYLLVTRMADLSKKAAFAVPQIRQMGAAHGVEMPAAEESWEALCTLVSSSVYNDELHGSSYGKRYTYKQVHEAEAKLNLKVFLENIKLFDTADGKPYCSFNYTRAELLHNVDAIVKYFGTCASELGFQDMRDLPFIVLLEKQELVPMSFLYLYDNKYSCGLVKQYYDALQKLSDAGFHFARDDATTEKVCKWHMKGTKGMWKDFPQSCLQMPGADSEDRKSDNMYKVDVSVVTALFGATHLPTPLAEAGVCKLPAPGPPPQDAAGKHPDIADADAADLSLAELRKFSCLI